jgi:hypothetical protein
LAEIEHGVDARKSIPDGGDEDARLAPEAATAPLVGVEEQHAVLEVRAEEANVLVAGEGKFGRVIIRRIKNNLEAHKFPNQMRIQSLHLVLQALQKFNFTNCFELLFKTKYTSSIHKLMFLLHV